MQEVLTGQYNIETFDPDKQKYKNVRKVVLKSNSHRLELEYNCILFEIKERNIVDIIIYKGVTVEELIPEEYNYACQGVCYRKTGDISYISFGGMILIIEGEVDLQDLDNVCLAAKLI
ncbi:hypothetical protein H311_02135 [Anncaliia algerae PRA109]|nr:hypothetical protein H311_02135 [Anncaliia algerae PRA109]